MHIIDVLCDLLSDADHNNIPHAGDHVLSRDQGPGLCAQDRPVTAGWCGQGSGGASQKAGH